MSKTDECSCKPNRRCGHSSQLTNEECPGATLQFRKQEALGSQVFTDVQNTECAGFSLVITLSDQGLPIFQDTQCMIGTDPDVSQ